MKVEMNGIVIEGTNEEVIELLAKMGEVFVKDKTGPGTKVPEEAKGKAEPDRLEVGEHAKVVVTTNGFSKAGDIVKVTEDDKSGVPFGAEHLDGEYSGWYHESSLIRAADEEVAEAKQSLLKEGDYARVISAEASRNIDYCYKNRFVVGTIVSLADYVEHDDVFKAWYLNGSDFYRVHRKDLEPLTKEEAEQLTRKAETDKKCAKLTAHLDKTIEWLKGDTVYVHEVEINRGNFGVATDCYPNSDGSITVTIHATEKRP